MKLLVKQELQMLMVHHEETLQSAFLWWIRNKNTRCHKFCPLCKFYFRCQEDRAMEQTMNDLGV